MNNDPAPLDAVVAAHRAPAEALLSEAPYAYFAMVGGDGLPYVVPMNFVYEAGRLYIHTGEGRKSAALCQNQRVCVAITGDVAFDPGPTPCEDGFSFRSLLVEGRATLLEDVNDRERALRAIVAKYDPDAAGGAFEETVFAETLVYAVHIETISYASRPRRPTGK
jgi:nitroimidazol reductase NimA-like FMN-containing flavoprotein (pyridoxamine 5'-phosphate oxidase superfamily)